MKSYIGAKIIQAEPMDEETFKAYKNKSEHSGKNGRDGYKVIYPDGYESWSPKDVFENAYREITHGEKGLV